MANEELEARLLATSIRVGEAIENQSRILARLIGPLEIIAEGFVRPGEDSTHASVLQMRDVERAKVYSEHLGKKLRKGKR